MSPDTEEEVVEEGEPVEPIGHVRVVYLGPVAPHWEVQSDYGPPEVIDQFRERVLARLVLLPPHDPQFRRNTRSGVSGQVPTSTPSRSPDIPPSKPHRNGDGMPGGHRCSA